MIIRSCNSGLAKLADWLQAPLLLVIRLYWGWGFAQAGWGKLTHLDKIASYFSSLHIPEPKLNAILAGSTECLGGLLLMIGLASRLISLPLIFILIIAYRTAESDALHAIFSDPDKFTGATPFLFLFATLTVLAFGPGGLSADAFFGLEKGGGKKKSGESEPAKKRSEKK